MKNILLSTIGITIVVAVVYYAYKPLMQTSPRTTSDKKYRIAIFQPASHAALDEIKQGLTETLLKSSHALYIFQDYNANGNPTLLRAQAEDILQKKYDLIFTIGSSCSKIVKEIADKKKDTTPIVCTAIDDPVELGLISNLQSSHNQVTCVTEPRNFDQQINCLLKVKPDIKKILLVYDPHQGSGLEKDRMALEAVLKQHKIDLQSIEIYKAHEIQEKVSSALSQVDVVLILKDHTACTGIQTLVKLCNQYHVMLYASDLNSSAQGAALAYGVKEYQFGSEGALKVQKIIEQNILPGTIPSSPVNDQKFIINEQTISIQNPGINQDLLNFYKH